MKLYSEETYKAELFNLLKGIRRLQKGDMRANHILFLI